MREYPDYRPDPRDAEIDRLTAEVEALRRVRDAAEAYSPQYDHDWRCEYRTEAAGWKPGEPPVIRCECGYDDLRVARAQLLSTALLLTGVIWLLVGIHGQLNEIIALLGAKP